MFVSVFSAQLGSLMDTCTASVYEAFWNFSHFLRSGGLWCLRIQRSAWFDSGYMRCVSLRGFLEFLTFFAFWWSLGDDFKIVSVFSAELGSTAGTCGASVYEAFRKNFTRFTCEVVSRR